jgi:hypothetical protein
VTNELRPLHEEAESELERAILSAGLAYGASHRTRAATLAALGLSRGAPRRRRPWFLTFAAAAAMVAVVSGGAVAALRYQSSWRAQRTVPPSVPTFTAAAPVARAARAVANAKPVSAPPPEPVETVAPPPVEVPAPPPPPRRSAPSRAPLAGELAVLDAATAAVAAGNSQRGLTLLDAYAKDYPRGRLGVEAEVLRIDALAQSGQKGAAASAAQRFLQRHPDSVLAVRARRYLHD